MIHQRVRIYVLLCLFAMGLGYDLSGFGSAESQHIQVAMRMIGHEVMLASGDSTSRIMPIVTDAGRYKIEMESNFQFEPSQLQSIVREVVSDTKISKHYLIEVENCETGEIVYAYEFGQTDSTNVMPCAGRAMPEGCYMLFMTLLDSEDVTMATNAGTDSISKSSVLHKSDTQFTTAIWAIVLLLLAFIGIYFWQKSRNKPIDNNVIRLGSYIFDQRNMVLMHNEQKIVLTSKEADLLALLHSSVNDTIERDVILSRVWGDEGDYVGRTLDVFISKLRKKLEADEALKIVNIRGVGYKLIVNG